MTCTPHPICSGDKIEKITRWAGHVARIGVEEKRIEGFGEEI